MIRGTTPTLEFVLPFETDLIEKCYITINQFNRTVVEKTLEDCDVKETEISCVLSQEETLKFSIRDDVEVQLRVKTKNGEALASNIIKARAYKILKEGVI